MGILGTWVSGWFVCLSEISCHFNPESAGFLQNHPHHAAVRAARASALYFSLTGEDVSVTPGSDTSVTFKSGVSKDTHGEL